MKIFALIFSASVAFIPSSGKIDPNTFIFSPSTKDSSVLADSLLKTVVEAQTMNDVESVIVNMPTNSTLTPSSVIALIESNRKINQDHYSKKGENGKNEIQTIVTQNQQMLLDGQKAVKKAKTLEEEVERLRNKLEGKK